MTLNPRIHEPPPPPVGPLRRLGRTVWDWMSRAPGGTEPDPAHRAPSGYSVSILGGSVPLGTDFKITYVPRDGRTLLWRPTHGSRVHVSVLKAESGTGKSTLLSNIYRAMRSRTASRIGFDFTPDLVLPDGVATGYVPQKSPMVRHWHVRDMLPTQSLFAQCLLPEQGDNLWVKRVGQLSGGEIMRLYAASALERLARAKTHAAFLLLDETLDGVGEEERVADYVSSVAEAWNHLPSASPLHVMLVSHKKLGEGQLQIPDSLPISMRILCRRVDRLDVEIDNS